MQFYNDTINNDVTDTKINLINMLFAHKLINNFNLIQKILIILDKNESIQINKQKYIREL